MSEQTPQKPIFISYCWKNSKEKEELCYALKISGIDPSVDSDSIDRWSSISDFMRTVDEHRFIVLFLSDEYLRSKPCMAELDSVMQLGDYSKRVLPVVLDPLLFNIEKKREYVRYWNTQNETLIKKAAEEGEVLRESYLEEFKVANHISKKLLDYLEILTDMKCPSKEDYSNWIISKLLDAGIPVLDREKSYYKPKQVEFKETKIKEVQRLSGKNELINWYFINPVNQRGAMSYDRWYTIDRWCLFSENIAAHIETVDNGLKCCVGELIDMNSRFFAVIEQKIEYPERYSERDVTFSVDVEELKGTGVNIQIAYMSENDENVRVAQKQINTEGMHSITVKLDSNLKRISVRIEFASSELEISKNEYVILKRVKLEFGEESTLHLDVPPIYHEELLRCQRYTFKVNKGIIALPAHIGLYSISYNISLPCQLRLRPSIYCDKYRLKNLHDLTDKEELEVNLQCDRVQGNMLCFTAFLKDRKTGDFALIATEDTVFDAELY